MPPNPGCRPPPCPILPANSVGSSGATGRIGADLAGPFPLYAYQGTPMVSTRIPLAPLLVRVHNVT